VGGRQRDTNWVTYWIGEQMKRADLLELEKTIMKEVVKRRALGGYSAEAEGVLILCETLMRVLQHMVDEYPSIDENTDNGIKLAPSSKRKTK
jgi:hypothetical protein